MERAFYSEMLFDRQADQIESVLTRLALPARVDGGVIREGRVRYHLTPSIGTQPLEVIELAEDVAQELGLRDVRVLRETGGLAIEVPLESATGLRLLPLIHALPRLQPLTAVVGMNGAGRPVLLELERAAAWHALIQAPAGAGKSELLRTLAAGLALSTRPAQLGMLSIDLSGRELTPLEALPHTLAAACEARSARELLLWVVDEIERRQQTDEQPPHLVLFVDDAGRLRDQLGQPDAGLLQAVLHDGPRTRVHLIAAARRGSELPHAGRSTAHIEASPEGRQGSFQIRSGFESVRVQAAWMSARDLDAVLQLVMAGQRTAGWPE